MTGPLEIRMNDLVPNLSMNVPLKTTPAHILVVEDDVNLLEGVCAVLKIHGYTVMTAINGQDALMKLDAAQQPPDLIVSDIMMPHVNGVQLLEAVRRRADWVNIPFIFLTALNAKSDIQRGKQLGVDDYLVKPFEAEDLVIAVESRLQRHRAMFAAHIEQISDLKRRILTILNHEFRTPLTFVVAYSDLLNTHTPNQPLSDGEMLNFLKGVNTGAVRLRRLIENFILLVELDTGDAQLNYDMRKSRVTSIELIMQRALSSLRDAMPIKNPVSIEVSPDIPSFVADADYLRVAVIQLLENAIKFSTPTQPIEMGASVHDGYVSLWVRDHGRGITSLECDQIWDSFYQINRAVHEDQGAGSGLAIVRGIATLHGGRADVQSEIGQGSLFTLMVPLDSD